MTVKYLADRHIYIASIGDIAILNADRSIAMHAVALLFFRGVQR